MHATVSIGLNTIWIPEAIALGKRVKTMMTNNPSFPVPYPSTVPALEALEEAITQTEMSYDAAQSRDRNSIAERNEHFKRLKEILRKLGAYVNLVADGDIKKLQSSGFDLRKTPAVKTEKTVLSAAVVRLSRGKAKETLIARTSSMKNVTGVEVHITDGDPTNDENWKEYGVFGPTSRIEITGLTRGREYHVRVRGISGTDRAPWSLPASEIAL